MNHNNSKKPEEYPVIPKIHEVVRAPATIGARRYIPAEEKYNSKFKGSISPKIKNEINITKKRLEIKDKIKKSR